MTKFLCGAVITLVMMTTGTGVAAAQRGATPIAPPLFPPTRCDQEQCIDRPGNHPQTGPFGRAQGPK